MPNVKTCNIHLCSLIFAILVKANFLKAEKLNMVSNGIDTVSTIKINDIVIGKTTNQFVRYVFDVKKHLKEGTNRISVAFESAPTYALVQSDQFKKKYNYSVNPGICNYFTQHGANYFSVQTAQSKSSMELATETSSGRWPRHSAGTGFVTLSNCSIIISSLC